MRLAKEFESIEELVNYIRSDECEDGIEVATNIQLGGNTIHVTGVVTNHKYAPPKTHVVSINKACTNMIEPDASYVLVDDNVKTKIIAIHPIQITSLQLPMPIDDIEIDKPIDVSKSVDKKWYDRYDSKGRKRIRKYQ